MTAAPTSPTSLEAAVHLIQVALTPVFLLSGIAALLNVFATRLGRVSDRIDLLTGLARGADAETARQMADEVASLRRRSHVLDTAVVLGALAATATCGAILALFLSELRASTEAGVLIGLFGFAILCTVGAVAAFGSEMLISSRQLRATAHHHLPVIHLRRRASPPPL